MHNLEALERRGWDALSGPGGAAFYEDAMADDGLMVFPRLVLDKAAALAAIRAEKPWTRYELQDVRVIEIGPNLGAVVYHAVASRSGRGAYRAVMSSVYARRAGDWQL